MDCFFHNNVPSVATCSDCRKPICATCHAGEGNCPGCRLAAKLDAAAATRQPLPGAVPPRAGRQQPAPEPQPQAPQRQRSRQVAVMNDSVESRALVALSYPLPPLALLALLDRKKSNYLRRQVYQSLAFTGGLAGFSAVLWGMIGIPFLNISAGLLLAMLFPVWVVGAVVYGIKTYNGDDVRIPVISDWIDERFPVERY